jgi:hypothetical protein
VGSQKNQMAAVNMLLADMEHYISNDTGFRRWTNRNPRGYVLNPRTLKDFMLHYGSCMHLADDRAHIRLSGKEKWCSVDKTDLIQLTFERAGRPPARCRTCNPK